MSTLEHENSPPPSGGLRVGIMGSPNWLDVAAQLFRCSGIAAEVVRFRSRGHKVRWVLQRGWRSFHVMHHLGGTDWRMGVVLAAAGQPVVVHWIGSDVLRLKAARSRSWRGWVYRLWVDRCVRAHLADSPELVAELRSLGVEARVVRLLPGLIEAEPVPLPQTFTVLGYWFDTAEHREFYGGNIVLALAREFPEVRFLVVRATGRNEPPLPNVTYLGPQTDMESIYHDSSVLIRLPKHDSLSAMVLEMLARGRYAIYSKPLSGCHLATNVAEARAALQDIMSRTGPNLDGSAMVKREFSLSREASALLDGYRALRHDLVTGRERVGRSAPRQKPTP